MKTSDRNTRLCFGLSSPGCSAAVNKTCANCCTKQAAAIEMLVNK